MLCAKKLHNVLRMIFYVLCLTQLHSERPKYHTLLAFLRAIGLTNLQSQVAGWVYEKESI